MILHKTMAVECRDSLLPAFRTWLTALELTHTVRTGGQFLGEQSAPQQKARKKTDISILQLQENEWCYQPRKACERTGSLRWDCPCTNVWILTPEKPAEDPAHLFLKHDLWKLWGNRWILCCFKQLHCGDLLCSIRKAIQSSWILCCMTYPKF